MPKVQRRIRRRRRIDRRVDVYKAIGRMAGLIAFPSAAILGQAELIGEPTRHYITVIAIVCGSVWAYCMKPNSLSEAVSAFKRR